MWEDISVAWTCVTVILFLFLTRISEELPTLLQLTRLLWNNKEVSIKQRYGDWAVVTGASDGIGKAYAKQLAIRGINIVLIGRNSAKLEGVADEIEKKYSVKTKIIIADFSRGREIYDNLRKELEEVDVALLVNNVGVQYHYPMAFAELPEDEIWDNVHVNVTSTTMMTRLVLPKMLSKNKGAIVNVSSSASYNPIPYMNLYAASKAYMTFFSEALREEVKKSDVIIQTLVPGYVSSKINHFQEKLQEVNFFIPDADTFADQAVRTLGRVDITTGYWGHRIVFCSSRLLPSWILIKIVRKMYKGYRRQYLQKSRTCAEQLRTT